MNEPEASSFRKQMSRLTANEPEEKVLCCCDPRPQIYILEKKSADTHMIAVVCGIPGEGVLKNIQERKDGFRPVITHTTCCSKMKKTVELLNKTLEKDLNFEPALEGCLNVYIIKDWDKHMGIVLDILTYS